MREKYVPAAAAYRKLKNAHNMNCAVYMFGATGYGKTRLVQEYLESEEVVWLTPSDEDWNLGIIDEKLAVGKKVNVVIDDLQFVQQSDYYDAIAGLIERKDIWLVLIGRMPTPQWMIPYIANGKLVVISEEFLHMTPDDVAKLAAVNELEIDRRDIDSIVDMAQGNAYMLAAGMQLIRTGAAVGDDFRTTLDGVFTRHLETLIIPNWSVDVQEFLMKLSVVDEFTLPMAVMITGDDQAARMLKEVSTVGNFITCSDGIYVVRPKLNDALRNRALEVFGLNEYRRYICNAGLFYETQDDLVNALRMYEKAEKKDNIRSLLIRNGRRHAGSGFYYELRRYYFALEDSEIETSPILMNAMSLLYSILMNPEKSEYWYDKLEAYSHHVRAAEKIEADELLLQLDIALPHRGNTGMIDIMKRAFSLLRSGNFKLPEFSVTNNCPSAMNGGKDFCDWSKKDQFLADTIGKMIERINGEMGRGLVHVALSESFYEKGGRDSEVTHQTMLAQMDISGGGKNEILFAAIGIQTRLSILNGNKMTAFQILDAFEQRIADTKNDALWRNIRAFRCRLALMTGENSICDKWMNEAPNELAEFFTLDRYRYLTKALCYLSRDMNADAIELLNKLRYYAEQYHRRYYHMDTGILLSIAYCRQGMEWKQLFLETLNEIEEYQFVRIITEKGAGALQLLKAIKKDYLAQKGADADWFGRVLTEAEMVAERYPGYLNSSAAKPADFGDTALTILRMQAGGLSIKEIAGKLNMAERTVKYHAAENYRKLDAKGKTDAVQKARSMNLI